MLNELLLAFQLNSYSPTLTENRNGQKTPERQEERCEEMKIFVIDEKQRIVTESNPKFIRQIGSSGFYSSQRTKYSNVSRNTNRGKYALRILPCNYFN